jgi:hypothetical protein
MSSWTDAAECYPLIWSGDGGAREGPVDRTAVLGGLISGSKVGATPSRTKLTSSKAARTSAKLLVIAAFACWESDVGAFEG